MNMPRPKIKDNYEKIAGILASALKQVAEKTMNNAADDICNQNLQKNAKDIIQETCL